MIDRIPRGLFVLLALLIAMHTTRAVRVASKQPTDFAIWYECSRIAADGGDPYAQRMARYPYIYPPLWACLVEPLTHLPYLPATAVFTLISSACWVWVILAGVKLCWPEDREPPPWVYFAVTVLPYRWVLNFMLHGQVDCVCLALLVLSFALSRRGRDVAAGFALAMAVIIKLLPAAFFGYYLLRGRWRTVAAGGVFVALLFVLPVARYGPARFVELLHQWRSGPLLTEIKDPNSDAQESNQGLAATIYRYGLPKPLAPPEDHAPALFHGTVEQVTRAYLAGAVVILAIYAVALWTTRGRRDCDALAFALTCVVLHVVSRRSWGYHYVTLAFVYAALFAGLARTAWSEAVRRPLRIAAVTTPILQNFYTPMIWGKQTAAVLSSYGPTTLSFLILVGCMGAALVRLGREAGIQNR